MRFRRFFSALLLSGILILSGCGDAPISWKMGEKTAISLGKETMNEHEMKLVALLFKIEYENYYLSLLGEEFWETEIQDGRTYEDFVKENCVYQECKALLYLQEIAKVNGLFLSEYEENDIHAAAQALIDAMSEDERQYTGATLSDIESLLGRYYLADRTIELLIQGKDIEISDEESRVCDIQVIRVSEEATARLLYERIASGENFMSLAKENTLDAQISYSVSRDDLISSVSDLIFSMADGEISDIISLNGSYYLIRIDSSYNSLQSLNNQLNILAKLRYEYWESSYLEAQDALQIRRNRKVFDELRLKQAGDYPVLDFFSVINP